MTFKLSDIGDKIREISQRQSDKIKARYEKKKTESEYWKEIEKSAEDWRAIMNSPSYSGAKRFLEETIAKLQEQEDAILCGAINPYTREERADKAGLISAQKLIVKYLMNEPERVIDLMKVRPE